MRYAEKYILFRIDFIRMLYKLNKMTISSIGEWYIIHIVLSKSLFSVPKFMGSNKYVSPLNTKIGYIEVLCELLFGDTE